MAAPPLGPPAADCTVVELDGCVSIFNPRSQTVHTLSSSATAVWWMLDGTHDLEDVVEQLTAMYGVPAGRARGDALLVLDALAAAGILPGSTAERG